MWTLLLRLSGPMQSWGTQSRFGHRDTGLEPSKSGVVGCLCRALGRPLDGDVSDLAGLAMGVRVDREGLLSRDFQTALNVPTADSKPGKPKPSKEAVISERFYLADADFLVGLHGSKKFLQTIEAALMEPAAPIWLGRKSYIPSVPLWIKDGLVEKDLVTALSEWPWAPRFHDREQTDRLRLVIETTNNIDGEARHDHPIAIAQPNARYGVRFVETRWVETSTETADASR